MKHIIDTYELEKLHTDIFDDMQWVRVADLRALIASSPQADGMVLVPSEPTEEMLINAREVTGIGSNSAHHIYKAMLSAYKPQADDVRKDAERYQWLCENKLMPWGLILDEKDLYELGIDGAIDKARE